MVTTERQMQWVELSVAHFPLAFATTVGKEKKKNNNKEKPFFSKICCWLKSRLT